MVQELPARQPQGATDVYMQAVGHEATRAQGRFGGLVRGASPARYRYGEPSQLDQDWTMAHGNKRGCGP